DYYYNHAGASAPNSSNREVKMTDSGRTVYGGGGITPDEKIESPKSNNFQNELGPYERNAFFHFAPHYLSNHTVDKTFQVDDAVLNDFKQYLTSQDIPFTEKELNDNMDWLKINIKDEITKSQFGQLQALRVMADWDPMIQKALTFLPEAQALEDTAHKVLAQKAEARSGVTAQ
ncbi:MAG: S41 family peptidase, partial [Terracidiphilus sp.]